MKTSACTREFDDIMEASSTGEDMEEEVNEASNPLVRFLTLEYFHFGGDASHLEPITSIISTHAEC